MSITISVAISRVGLPRNSVIASASPAGTATHSVIASAMKEYTAELPSHRKIASFPNPVNASQLARSACHDPNDSGLPCQQQPQHRQREEHQEQQQDQRRQRPHPSAGPTPHRRTPIGRRTTPPRPSRRGLPDRATRSLRPGRRRVPPRHRHGLPQPAARHGDPGRPQAPAPVQHDRVARHGRWPCGGSGRGTRRHLRGHPLRRPGSRCPGRRRTPGQRPGRLPPGDPAPRFRLTHRESS